MQLQIRRITYARHLWGWLQVMINTLRSCPANMVCVCVCVFGEANTFWWSQGLRVCWQSNTIKADCSVNLAVQLPPLSPIHYLLLRSLKEGWGSFIVFFKLGQEALIHPITRCGGLNLPLTTNQSWPLQPPIQAQTGQFKQQQFNRKRLA